MITVTDIKISLPEKQGILLGYASIIINNCLAIHDIKLIRGKRIFVNFPQKKVKSSYLELVHPINRKTRVAIENAIIAEYQKIMSLT